MKNSIYLFLMLGGFLLSNCQTEKGNNAKDEPKPTLVNSSLSEKEKKKEETRAVEGENVLLIINYVKDESKSDYEKFMNEMFFNLLLSSEQPLMQEQYQKTRWLSPANQNEDKSWTYAFFMDPLVENGNYEFSTLFQEKYSKEESEKLIQQLESFMSSAPDIHSLIQTKH